MAFGSTLERDYPDGAAALMVIARAAQSPGTRPSHGQPGVNWPKSTASNWFFAVTIRSLAPPSKGRAGAVDELTRRWGGGTVPGKAFHLSSWGSTPLRSTKDNARRGVGPGMCRERLSIYRKTITMQEANQVTSATLPELLTIKHSAKLCEMGERTFWRHSHSGAAPAP